MCLWFKKMWKANDRSREMNYVTIKIGIGDSPEDFHKFSVELKRLFEENGVEEFCKGGDNRDGTMDLTYKLKDIILVLKALPLLGECEISIH